MVLFQNSVLGDIISVCGIEQWRFLKELHPMFLDIEQAQSMQEEGFREANTIAETSE
jgi:hypothetical protein